jgi:TonB-linked SusC/RagA family outer membrane protein
MIMRLIILILITAIMQVSASSFGQKITLSEKNAPLIKVFDKIRAQSGVDFLVSTSMLEDAKRVSIQVNNAELEAVLNKLFEGQALQYVIRDKSVVVSRKNPSFLDKVVARFQAIDIRGTILDENRLPLVGATVAIKGTNRSIKTNEKGEFYLQRVGEKDKLVISNIGYQTKELVAAADMGTLVMVIADEKLEEITVNAGYYTVKDRERTGSIARVTAKDIENHPVTNVLSAVQGRMAGVSIVQNSGLAGGGYDIQIRGKNSLRGAGNSPLYVIDGVPVGGEMTSMYSGAILPANSINPLNSINPNDIESMEVLKDADATAIYGSRGANGVVLITTKKGKAGKIGISLDASYGMNKAMSNLNMLNSEQYLQMRKQAFKNDAINNYPANAYDLNGTWDSQRYTNWRETLIGKTANLSSTNLSLNGGNQNTSFLLSYGHNKQSTIFSKDFNYKTDNIKNNINHRSSDGRFLLSISNGFSIQRNNVPNEDITRKAYILAPNAPGLHGADGNVNWENNTFNNPVAAFNAIYANKSTQYLSNINAQYGLVENVILKFNGGINYQAFDEWSLRPHTIYNPGTVQGQSSAYSQSYNNNQNRFSYILEPQLNWKFKKREHELDVLAGITFQDEMNKQLSVLGLGFESNALIRNIGAARTNTVSDQIDTEYRYAAVFGRLNYQFAKKYIFNLTGRRDGSSRFGPNKKYANFGAVGAAWLFSEESPLKDLQWLSFGKLRGSYGTAGSDQIGDYQFLDTYTVSMDIYDDVTGLAPSRLYNPNYSWEKTTKLETALELSFFKSRINFTTSWYQNRSSSQLVGYQLPATTGFNSVLANLDATIKNSGWELEVNGLPVIGKAFKWETGLNISFPKNKLLAFPGLAGSTYANSYVIGQPVTIVKLYQFEGVQAASGLYKFTDFNGDGRISSPNDRQVVKNIGVKYFGGWNNSISYKGWDMSVLVQFVKQENWNYNNIMLLPGSFNNQPVEVLNVWSTENPAGFYMPYSTGSNGTKNQLQSLFTTSTAAVSDASFIRLKNVALGYRIPLQKGIFRDLKVYFQGQNLLTWTRYFGIDPEFRNIGYMPQLRTYMFGMQVHL